jgi:hypothetical protein
MRTMQTERTCTVLFPSLSNGGKGSSRSRSHRVVRTYGPSVAVRGAREGQRSNSRGHQDRCGARPGHLRHAAPLLSLSRSDWQLELSARPDAYYCSIDLIDVRERAWLGMVEWAQALAWPAVVLVGIIALVVTNAGRELLSRVISRLKRVEAFGISVELTEQAARKTTDTTKEAFKILRGRIDTEFDSVVRTTQVNAALTLVMEDVAPAIDAQNGGHRPGGLRATIYVEDPLYQGFLYQLLEYWPQPGGPRGRILSQRFGTIGQSWRSSKTLIDGEVPTKVEDLIERWGMTQRQARAAGEGRHSFLVFPLNWQATPVGLLYADAKDPRVFGSNEESPKARAIIDAIALATDHTNLAERLWKVRNQVLPRSPTLEVDP